MNESAGGMRADNEGAADDSATTDSATTNSAGIVLCGGASRRMGTNKALLQIEPGYSLLRRGVSLLVAMGINQVVAAVGDDIESAAEAMRIRDELDSTVNIVMSRDREPNAGPASALIGACDQLEDTAAVVVIAVDLPWLDKEVLAGLIAELRSSPAVVGQIDGVDQWQTIAFREELLPELRSTYDRLTENPSGTKPSMGALISSAVNASQLGRVEVSPNVVKDVDSPDDWTAALTDGICRGPSLDTESRRDG